MIMAAVTSAKDLIPSLQTLAVELKAVALKGNKSKTALLHDSLELAKVIIKDLSVCLHMATRKCTRSKCNQQYCRHPHSLALQNLIVYVRAYLKQKEVFLDYKTRLCENANCEYQT